MKKNYLLKLFILIFISGFNSISIFSQTCTNCGFGTNVPLSKLHVKGCGVDSLTSALRVTDSTTNGVMLFVRDDHWIGMNTRYPKAALDIVSDSSGILIPRMTQAQRNAIASPPTGLLIYQTNSTPGFYYYDGSGWLAMSGGTVPVASGGTGLTSYTVGDMLYASGATTLSKLADVSAGSYLCSGGVTTAPLWSTLKLPNSATANYIPYATSSNTWGESAFLATNGTAFAINDASHLINKLSVRGDGSGIQRIVSICNNTTPAAGVGTAIDLGANSTGNTAAYIAGAWTGAAQTDGYLALITRGSNTLTERLRIENDGDLFVGQTAALGNESYGFRKDQNATTSMSLSNATNGTAGAVYWVATNTALGGSGAGTGIGSHAASYTSSGMYVADAGVVFCSKAAGLNVGTSTNTQTSFWTNNTERVRILGSGEFFVGRTAVGLLSEEFAFQKDQNASSYLLVRNATSGTAARAGITISGSSSDGTGLYIASHSAGWATSGMSLANASQIATNETGGLTVGTAVSSPLSFWTNNTERVKITNGGLTGFSISTPSVTVDINGGVALRASTKAQITANQNDYSIGSGSNFRMSSDASRNVTGITGGSDGKMIIIRNVGSQNIVFTHEDANSTAANRFTFSTGGNITVAPNGSLTMIYDSTSSRWFDISAR